MEGKKMIAIAFIAAGLIGACIVIGVVGLIAYVAMVQNEL